MRKTLIAVAIILIVAVLASIAPPGSQSNPAVNSLNHAKSIWFACKAWAEDNDGKFPPSLDVLYPNYEPSLSNFVSPLMPHDPMGYAYTPGLRETTSGDIVLVEDKAALSVKGMRIVVYFAPAHLHGYL